MKERREATENTLQICEAPLLVVPDVLFSSLFLLEATMPRRILLAVSGLSPQILTETIYALAVSSETKWVPDEVHLITTLRGREEAKLNLLKGKAWFKKLCQDYKLPNIAFNADDNIHVIKNADGNPLEDIRTPQDNDAAADEITSWIRKLTHNNDSELHVSIAGGRKTLGFFAGYALSLFGRDQDRLSHVLVSSPYENHKLFFYPTPYERIIHTKTKPSITLNCQSAEVWLADIPFVRLRDYIPKPLLNGRSSFSETVAAIRRPAAICMRFDSTTRTVALGGKVIELTFREFAVYAWLARRAKEGKDPICFDTRKKTAQTFPHEEFLSELRSLDPDLIGNCAKIERAINKGIKSSWFKPIVTVLNAKLAETLIDRLAYPYLIQKRTDTTKEVGARSLYEITVHAENIDMGDQ